MFEYKNPENNKSLTEKLMDFLKTADLNEPMEVKPKEYLYSKKERENDLEIIQKDTASDLDKQLDNIR